MRDELVKKSIEELLATPKGEHVNYDPFHKILQDYKLTDEELEKVAFEFLSKKLEEWREK